MARSDGGRAAESEEFGIENARLNAEVERLTRALGEAQAQAEVAARRLAEAEESERILDAVMEHVPAGIIVADAPDVRLRRFSRHAQEPTGQTTVALERLPVAGRPEALSIYCLDGTTRPTPEQLPLTRATQKGETVRGEEWVLKRPDGALLHVLCNAGPIRDASGATVGGVLAWMDITARQEAEDALKESEERYRRLVERSPEAILVFVEGRIAFSNEAGFRLLGGERAEDILGRHLLDFVHPDHLGVVRERYHELLECGRPTARMEQKVVRLDKSVIEVETTAAPISYQGHPAIQSVVRDISERKRVEEERERALAREQAARAEAQEANRTKDRFLAVLSHELRNPLTPILAGVSVLRQAAPPDERVRRTVDAIERNVKLEARLVDDLLDLSRIARGKILLQRSPTRLDAVVRTAVQAEQSEAEKAGLALQLDAAPDLWVLGDPDRLQQVVMNLITNAVKFTASGGEIRVRMTRADGCARITVEDTGIGIPPDLLPQLFRIFEQGEVSGKRTPGLGIGLALVKSFTEMHGGRVWAESEGPGKGSRFTVELPLVPGPQPTPPAEAPQETDTPVRLLVIEDNADTLALLKDSLEMMGYAVEAAASGEEALELLRRARPQVILSDIGLPGMDGYEFLRRARALPGLAGVPAFALTGWGQDEDVRQAREVGYAGHFTKPVDVSVLDERIREWLGSAHARG